MFGLPDETKIWLAACITNMRARLNGLAAKVKAALTEDPHNDHEFVLCGR